MASQAIDTNLLMRLVTNDDPDQARRTAAAIDACEACFVPLTVTLELEWVLRGAYRLSTEAVVDACEALLGVRHLHFEQEPTCALPWASIARAWISPMLSITSAAAAVPCC